jgi:hypothetical protein
MVNTIDTKQSLALFNHVLANGVSHNDGYRLDGLLAWHDFDGYTCFLQYRSVVMTMMFHGKYELTYKDKDDFIAFEKRVNGFSLGGH